MTTKHLMANGRPPRCPDSIKPYSVCFYGSHPDLENDDCFYGEDFDTLEEALVCFQALPHDSSVEYIELDGAEGPNGENLIRRNPSFRRYRDDGEWAREHAMQMGMGLGVEAYNDAQPVTANAHRDRLGGADWRGEGVDP